MYYAKKLWAAGGGVIYNFVPFVAPESFIDPKKYADYGLTVNLYEKFRVYKMTWSGADIAVGGCILLWGRAAHAPQIGAIFSL